MKKVIKIIVYIGLILLLVWGCSNIKLGDITVAEYVGIYVDYYSDPNNWKDPDWNEICLDDYIEVIVEGENGSGCVRVFFDVDKLVAENSDKITSKDGTPIDWDNVKTILRRDYTLWVHWPDGSPGFFSSDGTSDSEQALCNGDVISIHWAGRPEELKSKYNVNFRFGGMEYTITGLTD